MKNKTIYSIGHSNITMQEFIKFLRQLGVKSILDIRSSPGSKFVPHFNKNTLEKVLKQRQIQYIYCGDSLGGKQNFSFKEYTRTKEYLIAIEQIERIIDRGKSALLCSEIDYSNCHRRYISETLINDGYDVIQMKSNEEKSITKQISLNQQYNNLKIIYTIGYTKKSLETFITLLKSHNIEKIVDIRLKNTSQLAGYAKADDLKYILEKLVNIKYSYEPDLCPTEEIFNKYKKDKNWDDYVKSFKIVMKKREIEKTLENAFSNYNILCLLCSEDIPDKCHRRLVAEYYKKFNNSIEIKHLTKNDLKSSNH